MKREKPDAAVFAKWVEASLEFDDSVVNTANGLWNHWIAYAGREGTRLGTRRSLSNALRRIGCPWERANRNCRRRRHIGVRVKLSRPPVDPPPGIDPQLWARMRVDALVFHTDNYW